MHVVYLNPSIPLLVTNSAALLEWKPMDWTQPSVLGGGREEKRRACGQKARESEKVVAFWALLN